MGFDMEFHRNHTQLCTTFSMVGLELDVKFLQGVKLIFEQNNFVDAFIRGTRAGAKGMIHTHLDSCINLFFLEMQVCSEEEAIFVLHLVRKITESLVLFLSHLIKTDLDIIFPS